MFADISTSSYILQLGHIKREVWIPRGDLQGHEANGFSRGWQIESITCPAKALTRTYLRIFCRRFFVLNWRMRLWKT